MTDLFIIEAPGKARHLEGVLKAIGIEARVQATKGHLYVMPSRLTPLGIDRNFHEFERSLRDPELGARIRDEVKAAGRVFIATDADQEGDVIAWDVAELISDICPDPLRVRLRGMDEESVKEAVASPEMVTKRDAVPGRTRAIVDRMIGATFSHDGIAVGRIGSALLGLVEREQLPTARLHLVAPSKDGGRPWQAMCDIKPPLDKETAKRLSEVKFPALDSTGLSCPLPLTPGHMGDVMVKAGDVLDMSPKEAERSMQRLYEAGRMSYPRANSRGISRSALRKIGRILKKSGYSFDEDKVAEKPQDDVHDAPYPIGNIEVQQAPERQGMEEGLRTLVGREILKSGQDHKKELGIGDRAAAHLRTRGFSEEVCSMVGQLEWRREIGPRYPGQESWPKSRVENRRPDTVLLEAAVKAGLGRPSTWASHIENFMSRGLVTDDLRLTDKGRIWLAAAPEAFRDPRISAAIEAACEKSLSGMMDNADREPWELLSEFIVSVLPDEVRAPLVDAVDKEAPRPRKNPTAQFQATEGLDDILGRNRDNKPAYAPRPSELPQ